MVNGGIKAQTQIKVLTSQVQTLKKNGKKRGASSGGSTAGKPAGKATAEENNGELRTAIGIQTPSQIMAVIITLNSFLSLFSYATTTFMCPKYDMDDTNACTNVAMQKAVDKKGNKIKAFKVFEKKSFFLKNKLNKEKQQQSRDLGERQNFKPIGGGFTCATRTSDRSDAKRSCSHPTLSKAERKAANAGSTPEWDEWFAEIGSAVMAEGAKDVKKATAALLGEAARLRTKKGLLGKIGSKLKSAGRKIGSKIKSAAENTFRTLAKKLLPKLVQQTLGLSDPQYKCLCAGYMGQIGEWITLAGHVLTS